MGCLILEYEYQAYLLKGKGSKVKVHIRLGTVDLNKNTMLLNDASKMEINIRRSTNNERARPNAKARHDPFDDNGLSTNKPFDLTFAT